MNADIETLQAASIEILPNTPQGSGVIHMRHDPKTRGMHGVHGASTQNTAQMVRAVPGKIN
jgi:hypothetical protein